MYLPKKDIRDLLLTLTPNVMQTSQYVFTQFPTLTFEVLNNSTSLDLGNEILYQDITVKIDIWAEDSITASDMLAKVEKAMRTDLRFRLEFSGDVPNPDKSIFHITTRFRR